MESISDTEEWGGAIPKTAHLTILRGVYNYEIEDREFTSSRNLFFLPIIFLMTLLQPGTGAAQTIRSDSLTPPPAVEIAGTQSLHFTSSIVGQEFNLYVNLPREYQDTTKSLPVVYLLDGQWDFPLLNAIFGEQYYDGFIPGVIVVGIAWGGNNPNFDMLRARDLTPTPSPRLRMAAMRRNF